MSERDEIPRYLENWQDEVDSAAEYRAMAAAEADPRLARVYANLAAMEEAHIAFWEDRLRKAGASVPRRRPSWRSRVLGWIARRFGPELVLPTIAAKEEVDQNAYVKQPETAGTRMPAHERWHAKVLKELVTSQPRGLEAVVHPEDVQTHDLVRVPLTRPEPVGEVDEPIRLHLEHGPHHVLELGDVPADH